MGRKKVCIISQFPPPMHGLSKAVDTIYNSYLKNKYELEIVDTKDNKKFIKNIWNIMNSKADLFYFTISQSVGGNLRDLIILELLKIQRKKCLVHLHGGYYRELVENDVPGLQRKMNYHAIRDLEGVVVLSSSLRKIFEGMIDSNKVFVVENCADDEFILPFADEKKKCEEISHKSVHNVLYLSNFIKEKGYRDVLELALFEKKRVQDGGKKLLHFHFAGKFFDKSEKEYFSDYVNENDLGEYVSLYGVVGGKKKQMLLRKCDMFILPTRYPKEGQPISILEAMGNAMYVITTNHAGIPDVIEDGINGIVATEGMNTSQLYERILAQGDISSICNLNYTQCISRFSQATYIKSIENVWNSVLDDVNRR